MASQHGWYDVYGLRTLGGRHRVAPAVVVRAQGYSLGLAWALGVHTVLSAWDDGAAIVRDGGTIAEIWPTATGYRLVRL